LGTFLSVITLQTYLSSGQTEVVIRNNSLIQENVRFAIKIMGDSIYKAGYREVGEDRDVFGLNADSLFPFAGDDADQVVFAAPSHIIWGQDGDDASDELFIRYRVFGDVGQGLDAAIVDCHGQQIAFSGNSEGDGFIQLRYFVTANGLSCVSNRIYSPGNTAPNGSANPITTNQPIVDGVTDMQLLYGYDNNGDGSADQYVSANDALLNRVDGRAPGGAWQNVVSVDIQMSFTDPIPVLGSEPVDRQFGQVVALRNL